MTATSAVDFVVQCLLTALTSEECDVSVIASTMAVHHFRFHPLSPIDSFASRERTMLDYNLSFTIGSTINSWSCGPSPGACTITTFIGGGLHSPAALRTEYSCGNSSAPEQ
eukprot:IDg15284t1